MTDTAGVSRLRMAASTRGGGSYDPRLGYYFINSHDRGGVQKMVAQVPAKERPTGKISGAGDASQMPFRVHVNVGSRSNDLATGLACVRRRRGA